MVRNLYHGCLGFTAKKCSKGVWEAIPAIFIFLMPFHIFRKASDPLGICSIIFEFSGYIGRFYTFHRFASEELQGRQRGPGGCEAAE